MRTLKPRLRSPNGVLGFSNSGLVGPYSWPVKPAWSWSLSKTCRVTKEKQFSSCSLLPPVTIYSNFGPLRGREEKPHLEPYHSIFGIRWEFIFRAFFPHPVFNDPQLGIVPKVVLDILF
jgi:hypothetical protein